MQRLPASTEPTNNKQNDKNNNKCNKKQSESKRERERDIEREGKQNKAQSEEMATAEELIATTKYKIDEAKNIMKNN